VEEALIEMYLAGVSVRRVEDITEAQWGTRVSAGTVSNKIYAQIEAWRERPIEGEHPYLYLDGIVLKRTWAGEVRNVSLLVAISVDDQGYRQILGIVEGAACGSLDGSLSRSALTANCLSRIFRLICAPRMATMSQKSSLPQLDKSVLRVLTSNTRLTEQRPVLRKGHYGYAYTQCGWGSDQLLSLRVDVH
jgi:hypothetical protein